MLVSIVVTHYKAPVLLKLCLKSIKENIGGNFSYEIIVVDGEAQPETEGIVKSIFPRAQLLSFVKNIGHGKMVNAGLKRTKGEYVLYLNADIIIHPGAAEKMIEYMEENPRVGLVGPQLLGFNNKPQYSCYRFHTLAAVLARRTPLGRTKWGKKQLDYFLYRDKDLSQKQKVDWIQGSALLIRQKAISKVGLMDERFFMYLEDTDWCRRFWQNGYEVVYLPEARMSHYHGRHSKKRVNFLVNILFNKYAWIHISSLVKFMWKWRKS